MLEFCEEINLETNDPDKALLLFGEYLVQSHFTFRIKVKSGDFSGTSTFCISKDEIFNRIKILQQCYNDLTGKCVFLDYDSDSFFSFSFHHTGKVIVEGLVGGSMSEHYMKYKFETDQTSFPSFIKKLIELLVLEDN